MVTVSDRHDAVAWRPKSPGHERSPHRPPDAPTAQRPRQAMSGVGRVTPAAGRFIAGEQRVAVLWRTVLDALFVLDDDRMLVRVNGHAGELLRAPVDDIVGRRIDEFVAQASWPL